MARRLCQASPDPAMLNFVPRSHLRTAQCLGWIRAGSPVTHTVVECLQLNHSVEKQMRRRLKTYRLRVRERSQCKVADVINLTALELAGIAIDPKCVHHEVRRKSLIRVSLTQERRACCLRKIFIRVTTSGSTIFCSKDSTIRNKLK